MEKYGELVSLGYVCNVPALLVSLKKRQTAYPFDSVGSPAWAVNELLANDFSGVFDNTETKTVFEGSDQQFLVDTQYYLRATKTNHLDRIKEFTTRRVQRLKTLLSTTSSPVLFIRTQECQSYQDAGVRTLTPEHAAKYAAKTELEYMSDVVTTLKSKYPSLQFKILFISNEPDVDAHVVNDNLVVIQGQFCDYRSKSVGKDLKDVITQNKAFLDASL